MSVVKKIRSSELFRITSLNSISVLLKIGVGLITSKVLAIFVGPTGMALLGNLRNFLVSMENVASLGFQSGIVKYVAENEKDNEGLKKVISTLFCCLFLVTIVFGILLFVFAEYLNTFIFGKYYHFEYVFRLLAFVLPLHIGGLYMNAVINGLGKFKKVIYITIIGTFLSVLVTVILVFQYQIYGALISIIITPGLLFFVSLFFLLEDFSITTFFKPGLFDWNLLQNLSHYFLMALVSGIFGPLVLLLVRNHLIASVSINAAGYWEAMSRISSYYLLFLNTLITVYYYPKMVLAENDSETKEVIQGFYKHIVPVFGIGLIVVFVLKNILIQLLFTDDFKPVEMLFFWQLIGDFFKGASLILGMQFFAKKMTKTFIVTELISLTILLFSSILLIDYLKTEGVVIAHAITYILYTCVLVVIFRKSLV